MLFILPKVEDQKEYILSIANPSPYDRSDYVEVNLQTLNEFSTHLINNEAQLYRLNEDGSINQELQFQVDQLLGIGDETKNVLSFFCDNLKSGPDDYSKSSAKFLIKPGKPSKVDVPSDLSIKFRYKTSEEFSDVWEKDRDVELIKLHNNCFEIAISLVPHLGDNMIDYAGSATNVLLRGFEMLAPFDAFDPDKHFPKKHCFQLKKLIFNPLPWEGRGLSEISLSGKEYKFVYSNIGPIRAVVVLQSGPFTVEYDGTSYLPSQEKTEKRFLKCYLYRIFSLSPDKPFIIEDLFV